MVRSGRSNNSLFVNFVAYIIIIATRGRTLATLGENSDGGIVSYSQLNDLCKLLGLIGSLSFTTHES